MRPAYQIDRLPTDTQSLVNLYQQIGGYLNGTNKPAYMNPLNLFNTSSVDNSKCRVIHNFGFNGLAGKNLGPDFAFMNLYSAPEVVDCELIEKGIEENCRVEKDPGNCKKRIVCERTAHYVLKCFTCFGSICIPFSWPITVPLPPYVGEWEDDPECRENVKCQRSGQAWKDMFSKASKDFQEKLEKTDNSKTCVFFFEYFNWKPGKLINEVPDDSDDCNNNVAPEYQDECCHNGPGYYYYCGLSGLHYNLSNGLVFFMTQCFQPIYDVTSSFSKTENENCLVEKFHASGKGYVVRLLYCETDPESGYSTDVWGVYEISWVIGYVYVECKGSSDVSIPEPNVPDQVCIGSASSYYYCTGEGPVSYNDDYNPEPPKIRKRRRRRIRPTRPECDMECCSCEQVEAIVKRYFSLLNDEINELQIKVLEVPRRVETELSGYFSDILFELSQIKNKLKDDPWWRDLLSLISDILGILSFIQSLFQRERNYEPLLQQILNISEQIKDQLDEVESITGDTLDNTQETLDFLRQLEQIIREIKQLLEVPLQGAIDAITCDGEIYNNGWNGRGIEGLNQAITAIGNNIAVLHADICNLKTEEKSLQRYIYTFQDCEKRTTNFEWEDDTEASKGILQAMQMLDKIHKEICNLLAEKEVEGKVTALVCKESENHDCKEIEFDKQEIEWKDKGILGLNVAIQTIGKQIELLNEQICKLHCTINPLLEGEHTFIVKCDDKEIEKENFKYKDRGILGLHENLTLITKGLETTQDIVCDLVGRVSELECGAVPVFPSEQLEERYVESQAIFTFVEASKYPSIKGSLWHFAIPQPKPNLIRPDNCWKPFENWTLSRGSVFGRIIWKQGQNGFNKYYSAVYASSETEARRFLERLASYSTLPVDSIRISKGGSPRREIKITTLQCVKVVVLERDNNKILVPRYCCRAPRPQRRNR